MSDISQHTVIIILHCYFLVTISPTIFAKHLIQPNQSNHSQAFQEAGKELLNQTILDYDFFSYDIIDHRTLSLKFDLTRTSLFQQSNIFYNAYLYVSKIPAINYRINIGPFSGFYQQEIDGTITDHFTFCLILRSKFIMTSNRNKTQTIFRQYLKPSNQEQYILHYCTKMGPDEDRHRHHKKQGSKGDHILLLLQITMIGIFLAILQISHISRNRKTRKWRRRNIRRLSLLHRFRREHPSLSHDGLALLRFITIHEEQPQTETEEDKQKEEEEEKIANEEEEEDLTPSHRRLPSPITNRIRSRSPSPNFEPLHPDPDDSSIEHILESKPWLQIPK